MAYGQIDSDKINTSVANTSLGAGNATRFKNRIINGDMRIDQRNAGASVTGVDGAYTLDRWCSIVYASASKYTVQQNASSVTPPVGFTNYLGVTSSSAYSVATSDIYGVYQRIEGYNIADMGFGTANAKTFTLSFWVRSSLTGTFGGSLLNGALNRSYPFTYTISSANTWEQKTITVAGDTSGTWLTTNGSGLMVCLGLGAGTTFSGTAGAWAAGTYYTATGATSVVGTNGATFYITGVQLEVGSIATGFEYVDYGTQLAMCYRYYESCYPAGYAPGYNFNEQYPFAVSQPICSNLIASDDGLTSATAFFKVTKRTSPTTVIYSPNNGSVNFTWTYRAAGAGNLAVTIPISTPNFVTFTQSLGAVDKANESYYLFTASAEL